MHACNSTHAATNQSNESVGQIAQSRKTTASFCRAGFFLRRLTALTLRSAFFQYACDKDMWESEETKILNMRRISGPIGRIWYDVQLMNRTLKFWNLWKRSFLVAFHGNTVKRRVLRYASIIRLALCWSTVLRSFCSAKVPVVCSCSLGNARFLHGHPQQSTGQRSKNIS